MNRFFLFIVLLILTASCGKPYVRFLIDNNSSDTIFVQYFTIDNYDTSTIQITPIPYDPIHIIWATNAVDGKTNWYSDYRVQIVYIKNTAGDSVNFNPNYASKWDLVLWDKYYNYNLNLVDSSFH